VSLYRILHKPGKKVASTISVNIEDHSIHTTHKEKQKDSFAGVYTALHLHTMGDFTFLLKLQSKT